MPTRHEYFRPTRRREGPKASDRGTSAERGYDADWQRLRASVLRERPICKQILPDGVRCLKPATQVHHVEPIRKAPHLRLVRENLDVACISCHSRITAKEMHEERKAAGMPPGVFPP
jgi:5-methylcytosine-specific restriction protein A